MSLVQKFIELDRKLFVLLNSLHTEQLDPLFYYVSGDWTWLPLYLFFIYLIIKKFKKLSWLPLLAIALAVTLSDQTSSMIKKSVKRARPSHDVSLGPSVHSVNGYKGGTYGFVSSHAANTFCIALLISLQLGLPLIKSIFLFVWAFVVSYSRIYLGVHFPADIVLGAALGLAVGFLVYEAQKKAEKSLFYKATLP